MSQDACQEPFQNLPAPTLDMHRAISTLIDELRMLDALTQRHEGSTDPELRLLLAHNRDAGKKQVAMLLEWLRRRDAVIDKEMKEALFKAGPIVAQYHYE